MELSKLLGDEHRSATDRFWEAEMEIRKTAKVMVDAFDGHSRSTMTFFLYIMVGRGIIGSEDLDGFSRDVRTRVLADFHE
jgi:hypothetical protein